MGSRLAVAAPPAEASGDERELLDAVRAGDDEAFGALYARHRAAVERLAQRLCANAADADDVASEVFCNTLRALRRGAGPIDDARPYLLRAVRHTVQNLRTRGDGSRAVAVAEPFDRPDPDDPFAHGGPATCAWSEVSDRFRAVLWESEVVGYATADIAAAHAIAPAAAASLLLRARRALRHRYVQRAAPAPDDARCIPIREVLPAYLDGDVVERTRAVVDAHVAGCRACAAACDDMRVAHERVVARGLWVLVPAAVRIALADACATVGTTGLSAAAAATLGLTSLWYAGVPDLHVLSDAALPQVEAHADTPEPTPAADAGTPAPATGAEPATSTRPNDPPGTGAGRDVDTPADPADDPASLPDADLAPLPDAPAPPPSADPVVTSNAGSDTTSADAGDTGGAIGDVVGSAVDDVGDVVGDVLDQVVPVLDGLTSGDVTGAVTPIVETVVSGDLLGGVGGVVVGGVVGGVVEPAVSETVGTLDGMLAPVLGPSGSLGSVLGG